MFYYFKLFPIFSFSEKLRDELKEYPEETKTKEMKKASSYGSDINRSATLPRSHGVSLILSLRYNFWKSNYSPVSLYLKNNFDLSCKIPVCCLLVLL